MEEQNIPLPQLNMQCDNLVDLPEIELPEGYTLRTSTPEDGVHWVRILNESFGGERVLEDFVKQMVEHPAYRADRLFFICGPDGLPCATAGAYRDPNNLTGKCGYLHYVGVCPGHQGKKLGYWVSLAVMRKFAEEGCNSSVLATDDFRIPAIKTYLNLGFKPLITHTSHRNRWRKVLETLKIDECSVQMVGNEYVTLHPKCNWLPFDKNSWITQLSDRSLLAFDTLRIEDKNGKEGGIPSLSTSSDGGCTWSENSQITLAPGTAPHWLAECRIVLQTRTGALVAIYEDIDNMVWDWNSETRKPGDDTRLNVWACRSVDGGKTWTNCTLLVEGWCGALIDMKQLSNGRIAATVMDMLYDQGRHISFTYVSDDDGVTWQKGNILDFGGQGHHDGAMEPTFVELQSGKFYMLVRTNFDYFWEAVSDDCKNWRTINKSNIDASSSPGFLLRLASGRIALVWNRLYPEGQTKTEKSEPGTDLSADAASWQRSELSIAFSSDECKTWTEPVVVARNSAGQIAYPYLLEYEPGDLWVITRAPSGGPINFRLNESDFQQ